MAIILGEEEEEQIDPLLLGDIEIFPKGKQEKNYLLINMLEQEKITTFFNQLNLVFHAMIAFPLLLFVYIYLESGKVTVEPQLDGEVSRAVVIGTYVIAVGMVLFAFRRYGQALRQLSESMAFWDKIKFYRHLALLHYTLLTGVLALIVLGFFLTHSRWFTLGFVLVLVALSIHRPTLDKICRDLRLKPEERKQVMGQVLNGKE